MYLKPTRGLRQDDPLSTLLFILFIQGLTNLIDQCIQPSHWKPLTINRKTFKISHLTFADDILLFGQGTSDSIDVIHSVLNLYSTTS